MKRLNFRFLAAISLAISGNVWAEGLGPPSPASLLPPVSAGSSNKNLTVAPGTIAPELDPIFDMEDPSTLLEIDEVALTNKAATKKTNPLPPPEQKPQVAKTQTSTQTQPPTQDQTQTKTEIKSEAKSVVKQEKNLEDVPKLDAKGPLIPPLPLLATNKINTPKNLENKGPTPFLPSPPHPPLKAAANPPKPTNPPPANLLFMPMLAGVAEPPGGVNRSPTSGPQAPPPATPAEVTQHLPVPKSVALPPMPGVPDIAVILVNNQFFPSKIRLKDGIQTRLIFTTTNKKPAALVMERLQIQRWIAKEKDPTPASELERARWEVNRELSSSKVTEIVMDPKEGSYTFHDAISGASGEIEVEKK